MLVPSKSKSHGQLSTKNIHSGGINLRSRSNRWSCILVIPFQYYWDKMRITSKVWIFTTILTNEICEEPYKQQQLFSLTSGNHFFLDLPHPRISKNYWHGKKLNFNTKINKWTKHYNTMLILFILFHHTGSILITLIPTSSHLPSQ